MLDETFEEIMLRVEKFSIMDGAACRMLGSACILLSDDASAQELLQRLRNHIMLTKDSTQLFDANFYLKYVEDILGILEDVTLGEPAAEEIKRHIKDSYEVFLYNKLTLIKVLDEAYVETVTDKKRKNYWRN